MIETPTVNSNLTSEQLESIEVVKMRLSNLENEISIATKNLSNLKKEAIKVTNEREYQEELLEKAVAQFSIKSAELNSLEASVVELEKDAATKQELISKSEKELGIKEEEFNRRDEQLKIKESKIVENIELFRIEHNAQLQEKIKLNNIKDALLDVIKLIKWS